MNALKSLRTNYHHLNIWIYRGESSNRVSPYTCKSHELIYKYHWLLTAHHFPCSLAFFPNRPILQTPLREQNAHPTCSLDKSMNCFWESTLKTNKQTKNFWFSKKEKEHKRALVCCFTLQILTAAGPAQVLSSEPLQEWAKTPEPSLLPLRACTGRKLEPEAILQNQTQGILILDMVLNS